jgi:hypothetical protein
LTGVAVEAQTDSFVDITMAQDALARVSIGADGQPADVASILPFTRRLIAHEWMNIQVIANHLVVHQQLDYDQVVRLIQG